MTSFSAHDKVPKRQLCNSPEHASADSLGEADDVLSLFLLTAFFDPAAIFFSPSWISHKILHSI